MKSILFIKHISALTLSSAVAFALALGAGCVVEPYGEVGVGVAGPVAVVPDDYYWDGYEYVGFVGGQYYYLGPGNVWLACDSLRLGHIHAWVGGHPDWRMHAMRNYRYRTDSHGHFHPRHD